MCECFRSCQRNNYLQLREHGGVVGSAVFAFKSEKTNELNDWAIIFTAHILGQLVITSQAMSVDPPEVLWTFAAKIAVHTQRDTC
jgi:hypothetical protein